MVTLTEKIQKQVWSAVVLFPIGVFSLLYILFKRSFAKIYLEFSFLSVPVFVGEILLLFCLLLLVCYCIKYRSQFKPTHFFVLIYPLWVAFKSLVGCHHWGSLAFRHAALFYYPFFFIIGFIFFNRYFFTKNALLSLIAMIVGVFACRHYDSYWTVTLACLGFILILALKEKKLIIFTSLILIIVIPYYFLFKTARMMFVSNTASLLIIMAGLLFLWETKFYIKAAVFIFILLAVSFGFYKFFILGESGRIFSSPGQIVENFRKMDRDVQEKGKLFKMAPLQVKLFHQDGKIKKKVLTKWCSLNYESFEQMPANSVTLDETNIGDDALRKSSAGHEVLSGSNASNEASKKINAENEISRQANILHMQEEIISDANINFRIFIWRDMFVDWKARKLLMGMDFGKPFRSPCLEMMHWAETEWSRDGWIEPHNSYFNILYRGGVIGLILVGSIWGSLFWFIKLAFCRRSWILILLAAILLNWMVAANFLLILELPYTAIPFWSLAGMAFAYAYENIRVL
ncbi:MAG: hypothetical protein HQL12_02055 [Candidatus Omnitrophica bacterium]|nr:hypothetical protein [Candidatus Omnitrophota bacterium]